MPCAAWAMALEVAIENGRKKWGFAIVFWITVATSSFLWATRMQAGVNRSRRALVAATFRL